jgi:hypothetical protein
LPNENESQSASKPASKPEGWWVRFVSKIEGKLQQRKTKKAQETPVDRAARITANATVWMAAFTAVLVLVGIGTLCILKNQLHEMHTGGLDTHDLAVAAGKQADIMEATIRPYVGVDSISTPQFQDATHTVSFDGSVKNFGSAPATHFTVRVRSFLNDKKEITSPWRMDLFPATLFPGQIQPVRITYTDPEDYRELKSGANGVSICFIWQYKGAKEKPYDGTQGAMWYGMGGPAWSNWGECPGRK